MTDKPASPFAGIKLSEQTSLAPAGADQRLFAPQPSRQKAIVPTADQQAKLPRNQARKEGTLETRNQGSKDSRPVSNTPRFDITEQAYRNNTYSFTDEELEALEDTKIALRRHHGVNATKNNLIRLGIHLIIEDFLANKADSIAVRRLKKSEG